MGSWRTGSIVVVPRLSCFVACGIFPDQTSVPALQGRLLTTGPSGKPPNLNLNSICSVFQLNDLGHSESCFLPQQIRGDSNKALHDNIKD